MASMKVKLRLNPLVQYRTLLSHASNILATKTPVNLSFKIVGLGTTDPEAPPIFLLHGLLGSKKLWRGIGKTITPLTKRSVIVVDIRNHGASPHINSNRYDEMAADLFQLFEKLHVDKASLVGYEIGGRMAMCASLMAPQRVAGLVAIEISPVSTCEHMRNMIKILKAMKAFDFKNAKKVDIARCEVRKQMKELVHDEVIMHKILKNVQIKHDGIIGWSCNLDAIIKHFKQFLIFPKSMKGKKYNGPCLFIGGQLSDYLPADDLTKIRELFPQAMIRYLAKATHNLNTEDPRSFVELLITFLNTNN